MLPQDGSLGGGRPKGADYRRWGEGGIETGGARDDVGDDEGHGSM